MAGLSNATHLRMRSRAGRPGFPKDLCDRTKAFALRIVRMFSALPKTTDPIPLRELDIEVGGRNNVGEIDCHSNVAGWVRSSDDAVILVDELPKRQD